MKMDRNKIIVNSVSGGKTSAYMASHYPADFDLFSLVCIDAEYCKPKDEGLVKYVSDKLGKQFIATAESDKTLRVVRDLEQTIGRNIHWVSGESFERVIKKRKAIPNQMWRFCTTELKLKPIFDFCQNEIQDVVEMQIGFRYDEKERGERNKDNTHFKVVIGKSKKGNRNKWGSVKWRELRFPLIDDKISHLAVYKWSKTSGLIFPDDEPQKMKWFSQMEIQMKRKWKKEMSYSSAKEIGLQGDFFFGVGSGCESGFCTD